MLRPAMVGNKPAFQGICWTGIAFSSLLKEAIFDLFPNAKLIPLPEGDHAHPERSMTALPVELDPGEPPLPAEPEAQTPTTVEVRQMPALSARVPCESVCFWRGRPCWWRCSRSGLGGWSFSISPNDAFASYRPSRTSSPRR